MVNTKILEMSTAEKTELFDGLLRQTGREGIEGVIKWMHESDFYHAPSSSNHHGNYEGGLLDHSLLVYYTAMGICDELMEKDSVAAIDRNSVAIATLLHDFCKIGFYEPTTKWKKDEYGQWQSYVGYQINDKLPIGHGDKSVIMLQWLGLTLTLEETLAIRWHMGLWDDNMNQYSGKSTMNLATDVFPLVAIIQSADFLSSRLLEIKIEK